MLRAVFPGLTLERAAYGFEVGGEPPDHCGPGGMVFGTGGDWLVANSGTGSLFRLRGTGVRASEVLNTDCGASDLAVCPDGRLFGSRKTEIVELDPANGDVLRSIAGGFEELVGLVFDASSGKLIVADFEALAIYEVDHLTGERSVHAAGNLLGSPNGIVVDDAGRVLVAGYDSRHVLAVERDGAVVDLGFLPGGPDGIALGGSDGPFYGSAIVNQRDGCVVQIAQNGDQTTLATGGTPGDLIGVDADGYLLVTQLEEIFRIGPSWFASQPWRVLPSRL
ncbi:MAG: hypothetical protein ACLQK4_02035 [Acidimicrobiales bacterium]|jgi:hypothetical protein